MDKHQVKTARQMLGLNQTDFAKELGWTTKRNIVNLERGDKQAMHQTALAIECLLRRNNKFGDFKMLNELKNDIENQVEAVKKALSDNPNRTIKITDNVCALDYKKYALEEIWNEQGNEFEITFKDSSSVSVSDEDFIKYQFQYTDLAIELEEKFIDYIDELRDMQQDETQKLLEA